AQTAELTASIVTTAEGGAEADDAAVGVAIALTFADHDAESTTLRSLSAGGAIGFQALGSSIATADSTASAEGAPESSGAADEDGDGESDVNDQIQRERGAADSQAPAGGGSGSADEPNADDSSGSGVSVGAAISLTIAFSSSTASIPSGLTVAAGGAITVRSSANSDATTSADGTAASAEGTAVAVGVAITYAEVTNTAIVGASTLTSEGATIEAGMTDVAGNAAHLFKAESKSGASAGDIGVAGSFSLGIYTVTTTALLSTGSSLDADANNDGAATDDVLIKAESVSSSTVRALPAEVPALPVPESVGVGASIAIAVVNDHALAAIADDAVVSDAADLTLRAKAVHALVTQAKTGAKSPEVAVAPAVAVTIHNVSSRATIGIGAPIPVTGSIDAKAELTASADTTAEGDTEGDDASVGIAIALTFADHRVESGTSRNLSAGGDVSFQALGSSNASAVARASAAGAPGSSDANAPASDVNGQVQSERTAADSQAPAGQQDSGSTAAPSAEDSSGDGVSVAASVSVNLATSVSRAYIGDELTIVAAGSLTVRSSANSDAKATADGTAKSSGDSSTAVGVGVAINLANVTNEATIGHGANTSSDGVTIQALMTPGGSAAHEFEAKGVSGGGGGEIGIAGSFALNIVNLSTKAAILSDPARGPPGHAATTVNAGSGDVTIQAVSDAKSDVSAIPAEDGTATGSNVGVGASIALNLVTDTTLATIEDTAILLGGDDLIVEATGSHAMTTLAETGAESESVAVAPGIAIAISTVTVTATLGTGPGLVLTGKVDAKAELTASATTTAKGDTKGGEASIGIAFALTYAKHTATASSARSIDAGNDASDSVSFQALSSSATKSDATAGAAGAPGEGDSDGPSGDLNQQVATERGQADAQASSNGGAPSGSEQSDASTSSGSVSVAAAVAINIAVTSAIASFADAITVLAGGAITLRSSANTDSEAKADGQAVGNADTDNDGTGDGGGSSSSSDVGIGVAVAINIAFVTNRATTGVTTLSGNGLVVEALMQDLAGDERHTFGAEATAGAGDVNIGVAGAVAISIVENRTEALVRSGATAAAGTGDVSIAAETTRKDTAKATSEVTTTGDDSVGVGVSVALNILVPNSTRAEIEDGATLTGGDDVTVSATSLATDGILTETKAGSGGSVGVSPAVAITIAPSQTTASIGTSPTGISATGAISIQATYAASVNTKADAEAGGDDVAVGAAVAIAVFEPTTSASTERNLAGSSVAVESTSITSSAVETKAGASGNDSSSSDADSTAGSEVQDNPNSGGLTGALPSADSQTTSASSTSSSESGQSSGGVGVAASISVNVVISSNTATVAPGLTLAGATGDVSVRATNASDAMARAMGTSLKDSADANIGAAVSVNYADVENLATVGAGATVSAGAAIAVEAVTAAGQSNDFVAWGIAAAGGTSSDVSVAGSVGVNVITLVNRATTGGGGTWVAGGGMSVVATAPSKAQNLALAGALGDTAVGAAVAVTVLSIEAAAAVGANETIAIGGNLTVNASATLDGVNVFDLLDAPEALEDFLGPVVIMSVAIGGAVSASGDVAVGGSVVVDLITLDVEAAIGAGTDVTAGGSVSVTAAATLDVLDGAGGLGVSPSGSAGIGAGVVVLIVDEDVRASVGDGASIDAGGDVTVSAAAIDDILTFAASVGVSNTAGVSASIIVVVLDGDGGDQTISATVGAGAAISSGGDVEVAASDDAEIALYAGGLAFGSSAGVGVSASILTRSTDVIAAIGAGGVVAADDVSVTAGQSEDVTLLAIGGGGASTAGVAGSATVGVFDSLTHASVGDGTDVTATGDVTVAASDETELLGIAGALAIGGTAGVGVGVDVEVLEKSTQAWIGAGASVDAAGNVIVEAVSSEDVLSISAGVAIGGTAAVSVNAGVSVLTITTRAFVASSTSVPTTVDADGSVKVAASDATGLSVISGNISVSGTASIGAAAAVPVVTKTTEAFVGDGAIVAARGLGAGVTAATGAFTVTIVDTRFDPATAVDTATDTITLPYAHGFDDGDAVVYYTGGGSPIGGLADGGVYYVEVVSPTQIRLVTIEKPIAIGPAPAGATGTLEKDGGPTVSFTAADVSGSTIAAVGHGFSTGDEVLYTKTSPVSVGELPGLASGRRYFVVVVDADSFRLALAPQDTANATVDLTAGGDGRAHRIVGANEAAVPGGTSQSFDPALDVDLGPNTITLPYVPEKDGTPTPFANGDAVTYFNGGGESIGGLRDGATYYVVGLSGSTFQLSETEGGAAIDLTSLGTGVDHSLVYDGHAPQPSGAEVTGDRSLTPATATFKGLAVTATNSDDYITIGVSGGAGTVAVNVGGAVNVASIETTAWIGANARVNESSLGADAGQSVLVAAANDFRQLGVAGAIAFGTVGVAPSANVLVVDVDVDAFIGGGALVNARNDVVVSAASSQSVLGIAAGIAGGTVGVGGAVAVFVLELHTYASIGAGADVEAGNNLLVAATDETKVMFIAGAIGVGTVGIGMSVGVLTIEKDTRAFIAAGAVVDGKALNPGTLPDGVHGVSVRAESVEDVFGLAISAGAGYVGVAGAVSVEILTATTWASIGDGVLVNLAPGAGADQDVSVAAISRTETFSLAGGLGAGFVGVGGAVDVGVLRTDTQAWIGDGSTVHAADDVAVTASAEKEILTIAVSVGAGFVGVSGSVSVWTIGATGSGAYDDGTEGTDRGNWAAGVSYDEGDVVTGEDGQRYAAKEAHTSTAATNPALRNATSEAKWGRTGADALATDAPKWADGESYAANDIVLGSDGNNYRARVAHTADPSTDPTAGTPASDAKWELAPSGPADDAGSQATGSDSSNGWQSIVNGTSDGSSTNRTNQRIAAGTSGAKSSLVGAAPGSGAVGNKISAPPSGGTVARIGAGATVVAGGDVSVRASEALEFNGVVGGVQAGFVAVGGSVLVLNAESNVEASIGANASITAGAGAGDDVAVSAEYDEELFGIAFGASGGFVAVGAQVIVMNADADQTARIEDGVEIVRAGGGVTVSATATREADAIAFGVSGGVVAAGAAIAILNLDGSTVATIGDALIGQTGAVYGVTVLADNDVDAEALAISIKIGGGALSGAVALAELEGATDASAAGLITVGSGGVLISAVGTRFVGATSPNIAVGIIAIGGTVATATNDHSTDATLYGTVLSGGGVTVEAISANEAEAFTPGANGGGLSVTFLLAIAVVSGRTRARLFGDILGSTFTTVRAHAENVATANAWVANISVIGVSGAVALADVTDGAAVEALVDFGASIASSGAVLVEALTFGDGNEAHAEALGIGAGGIAAIAVMVSSATVEAAVRSSLAGSVTSSGSITVRAQSANTADASTLAITASLFAGAGAGTLAEVGSAADTEALVGPLATLSSSGLILITASSANEATAESDVASGGLVGIAVNLPFADVKGATRARLDGDVATASSLAVSATSSNEATADALVIAVGFIGSGAGAVAQAEIGSGADTEALVGSGSTISVSGAIAVTAFSDNDAEASAQGGSGGLISIAVMAPSATVSGATLAQLDGDVLAGGSLLVGASGRNRATADAFVVNISLLAAATGAFSFAEITSGAGIEATIGTGSAVTVTGLVRVSASTWGGGNEALAEAHGGATGAINGGVMLADAEVASPVRAAMHGAILGGSQLDVLATGANDATASTFFAGIGLVAVSGSGASASVSSSADVEALIGSSATITGDVNVIATSDNDATAESDGVSGGLVSLGVNLPTATVSAATVARVDGDVSAGDDITVSATSDNTADASSSAFDFGLLFSGQGSSAEAEVTSAAETRAEIGAAAVIAAGGDVLVGATSANWAAATAPTGQGGAVAVAILLAEAAVSAGTIATVAAPVAAGSLTIRTRTWNRAVAEVDVTSISLLASAVGTFASAEITSGAYNHALLSAPANVTGSVTVDAGQTGSNRALATIDGTSTGILSGGILLAEAEIDAAVLAQTTASITADGSVTIAASGANDADASTESFQIGGLSFSGAGTLARIASGADVSALAPAAVTIAAGGAVTISASSNNDATASSDAASGSLLGSLSVNLPAADGRGAALAQHGGDVTRA
ncbi:MAG: beta strand repeat-containing protein, partial [Gaiellaceae bacterium]